MIIQFKSAPELGRLRVVKDKDRQWFENGCNECALEHMDDVCNKTPCVSRAIHFEQVKPNDN